MKIGITTLGCPDWDLDTLCTRGREYDLDGVDFRGLQDTLDVTALPAFTSGIAETRRKLDDAGLAVSGISSSIRLCEPEKLERNIEEAKRTIALAHELDCKNVRVFGHGELELGRERLIDFGQACVEHILALDGAMDLNWLFETHDIWCTSEHFKMLLDRVESPAFGALWDIGNAVHQGGEPPEEMYAAIGPRVGYVHIKDAVHVPGDERAMRDGWRYVLPGTGQLPLAEAIGMLKEGGYDGWLVYEHEKRWFPELEEPEVAFPAFVAWARGCICPLER